MGGMVEDAIRGTRWDEGRLRGGEVHALHWRFFLWRQPRTSSSVRLCMRGPCSDDPSALAFGLRFPVAFRWPCLDSCDTSQTFSPMLCSRVACRTYGVLLPLIPARYSCASSTSNPLQNRRRLGQVVAGPSCVVSRNVATFLFRISRSSARATFLAAASCVPRPLRTFICPHLLWMASRVRPSCI